MSKFPVLFLSIFVLVSFFAGNLQSKEITITPESLKVRIGLALSGGGSRGVAQIGVLKVLEHEGIEFSAVVGTSIGAFVGGLYSIGYTPEELEEIALNTKWDDVLTLLKEQERSELFFDQKVIQDRVLASLRFKKFKLVYPQALSLGWRFNSFIQKLVWKGAYYSDDFNKLKFPFRAVATDVVSGKTISISKGNLVTALRASSAIPLRNTPITFDTLILVDGGLFANIPVEQVKEFKPDVIIAINTTSPPLEKEELQKPWSLASQIINIFMDKFLKNATLSADIVIEPAIGKHPNDNFKGLDSLIFLGEKAGREQLPKIREILTAKKDSIIANLRNAIAREFGLSSNFKVIPYSDSSISLSKQSFVLKDTSSGLDFKEFIGKLDSKGIKQIRIFDTGYDATNNEAPKVVLEIDTFPRIKNIVYHCEIENVKYQIDTIIQNTIGKFDSPETRKSLIEEIKKLCAKSGFSFAKVVVSPSENSENLHLEITPNKIGKIKIDEKITTSEYIIRRELTFRQGEYTNGDKIAQSWSNIISTGLFSDVFIDFDVDTIASLCNIKIFAQERGTQVLNFLMRIDNERNIQGGVDFIHENLFNTGTRFLVSAAGGKSDFVAKIGLNQTRIWKTNFSLSAEAGYIWKVIPIFVRSKTSKLNRYESSVEKEIITEKLGAYISAGTQIERLGNFYLGFRSEKQRFYDQNESSKPNFYNFYTLKIGLIYDSRNRLEFPSDGRLINIFLETPLFKTTSSIAFTRAFFQHSINLPIKDLVIRPTITFGFADAGLPFPEFFSLGGEDNFPGFHEYEFLGRQIFTTKFEFQYRLPWKLYFDTFITLNYNIGSIWSQFDAIRISELKHSFGFSFGLLTPIGPVSFSLGRAFFFIKNPNAVVWGPIVPYFSIGNRLF